MTITPKTKKILNTVKTDTKKLCNQLKRDKTIYVSSDTLGLAILLSESIKEDRFKAKQMKEDLKQSPNWPFPKNNLLN